MAAQRTLVLLRLDETPTAVAPSDSMGSLGDFAVSPGDVMPEVVDAFTGRGRQFVNTGGMRAYDVVPGSSLATRDASVQAIISWDFDTQSSLGLIGSIVVRGVGAPAAEYVSYGIELRVIDAALRIGEVRWWWQTTAGVVKSQIGAHFVAPAFGSYMMITATRHWVSSSRVELAYFIGGEVIGEVISSDGDIGGGTTGAFQVGYRHNLGVPVTVDPMMGIIDELRVLNYPITVEEAAATWDRMSKFQPRGYTAIKQLFQTRAPISDDPGSSVQKLFRVVGHAIGYAQAQIENMRQNVMPDRAYGSVLQRWERITGEPPKPVDTVDARRRRVVSHLRQRAGVSIPGVRAALGELLQIAQSQIEVYGYDATILDDMLTARPSRWWFRNVSGLNGIWLQQAYGKQASMAIGIDISDTNSEGPRCCVMSIDALTGVVFQGKRTNIGNLPDGGETGVIGWDFENGHRINFGIRNTAGSYQIVYQKHEYGVPTAAVLGAVVGNVPIWFRMTFRGLGDTIIPVHSTSVTLEYSVTGPTSGFVVAVADYQVRKGLAWMGFYARSTTTALTGVIADYFDDARVRIPYGSRALQGYVYRDPALAGSPDLIAGNRVIRTLKQAHTAMTVISDLELKCDDASTVCDEAPMGGY